MRTPPLILIVDDNPSNVEILQMRLAANDYRIITASDGEKGLAAARKKQPDLILLDIMMPKIDGIEVCRRIKEDSSLPFMPIIMVTAKANSKDVVVGLDAGADEYLTKPVDHAALVARVKSMLRIKALHDTVFEQSTRLRRQLETATMIQSLFWPTIPELQAGSHIWAISVPATYVGGDLYDVIPLPDGSMLIYVADVSDKGVPAALIMAALSTKIRGEVLHHTEIDQILKAVNHGLYRLAAEEGFFATIAISRYWPHSGKIQLSLGGHIPPVWISNNTIMKLPSLKGLSLGIAPQAQFEKIQINLSPGDSILFFTDGVVDAQNEAQEFYGQDRMVGFLEKADGPPRGQDLLKHIERWRGTANASDDLTLLEIWHDG